MHLPLFVVTAVLSCEAAMTAASPFRLGFVLSTPRTKRQPQEGHGRRWRRRAHHQQQQQQQQEGNDAAENSRKVNGARRRGDLKTYQSSLPPVPPGAHRVVLMRHGESEFNNANIFTGWCDVALTPRGVVEAKEAGQVFSSHNLKFRSCFASLLTRSISTAHLALEAAGVAYTPLQYDWRFNERHYGALQGLSKERTAERLGRARVMQWRRSYEARPPLMTEGHPHFDIIETDARYRHLRRCSAIPKGESLQDCQERVVQAWQEVILQNLPVASSEEEWNDNDDDDDDDNDDDSCTLLVAHANTLRALVMHLDNVSAEDIEGFNVPTAIPFYYDIDVKTGLVVTDESSDDVVGFRGAYIADERKKRSFLERRRAANDPWLWALYDEEVSPSMLLDEHNQNDDDDDDDDNKDDRAEGLVGLEEEATRNTKIFSAAVLDKTKKQEKKNSQKMMTEPPQSDDHASIMKHVNVPRP